MSVLLENDKRYIFRHILTSEDNSVHVEKFQTVNGYRIS